MHKRSKSYEPSSEMDEHRRVGNNGGSTTTTTTCDDSACGRSSSSSSSSSPATAQCSTVSVYRATINGVPHHVTATWTKTLINQSFTISISAVAGDSSTSPSPSTPATMSHKVELKPWPFWSSKKGSKALAGGEIEVFWDLRSAKFPAAAAASPSPEPTAGYYVAVVSDGEVALLLGDAKKDAFRRTRSRPSASLDDAVLVSRRESVSGKRSFAARAPLLAAGDAADIVVDAWLGGREPEMRIAVDGVAVVHVRSLQWKFRGNETVMVGESPVMVMWDVHDWVFAAGGGGMAVAAAQAVFVFKPGAPPEVGENGGGGGIGDEGGYSFFLHAWKTE